MSVDPSPPTRFDQSMSLIAMSMTTDELDAAQRAIKAARRIIGFKTDESNNDVEMDTMSDLSFVPAIILLNGALNHYGLKTVYFHLLLCINVPSCHRRFDS